jgi:hypothetical protein
LFVAGLFAAWPASTHSVAQAAGGPITIRLWPSGQGRIDISQGGTALPTCDFTEILTSSPCDRTVTSGLPLTLTAVPEPAPTIPDTVKGGVPDYPVPNPAFVRWSRDDCGQTTQCTFTPDVDQDWITALFTPLELEIGIKGLGTVTAQDPSGTAIPLVCSNSALLGFQDADSACHVLRAADTDVVLMATPQAAGTAIRWGNNPAGCRPDGDNFASAKCTVTMSNIRTFATVAFGPPAPDCSNPPTSTVCPPRFPFQITSQLTVRVTGSGHGVVKGLNSGDCRTTCSASLAYQSRVSLTAGPADAGSRFVGWRGICSTNPNCVFAAGSVSGVTAVFDMEQATTTTTTTTTPTAPTTTTSTSTTTNPKTTSGPTTTTTGRTQIVASLTRVSMLRVNGHRVVVVALTVDRPARATLRLLKRGKVQALATKTFKLAKGRNSLRFAVPKKTKPGTYQISLKVVSGPLSRTLTASVLIRR